MRPIEQRLADAGLPPLPRTAWIEVDLDAITSNLAVLRDRAGDGVPVHPVVKGDAYGHGAIPVAKALVAAGADGLCVATVDEAIALREAGVRGALIVLYPIPVAFVPEARALRIRVTAGDEACLRAMLDAAAAGGDGLDPLAIELDVETGLGRAGFRVDQAVAAAQAIQGAPGVRLAGLWSHFQSPETQANTTAQVERFEAAIEELRQAGIELPRRHLAASGSLVLGDVVAYDGVRPGLATYGLVPDELLGDQGSEAALPALRPALTLRARPVRVADLPEGWGISYGPTFTTTRPSRIATLPIGYGDGWSRALSNRAFALVRGVRVPLVGNVAMDAVMADVTDVAGDPVDVRDEFVLIGEQDDARITVADVASARGTNSWEVVTTLSVRLPRVYHAASVPQAIRTLAG